MALFFARGVIAVGAVLLFVAVLVGAVIGVLRNGYLDVEATGRDVQNPSSFYKNSQRHLNDARGRVDDIVKAL